MYKRLVQFLPLFLILSLSLALRLFALDKMPVRLHQDEIMNGYVGRFILLNGQDLHGNKWPLLYFDNFGDYPNVLPMYISGLFTFVFGVNPFAIRFPIALMGSLAVLPIYAITKLVTSSKKTALFASFCMAILPWHLVLSRATSEHVLGTTVFLTGIYLVLLAIKKESFRVLLGAIPVLLITNHIYQPFRIIVPMSLFASIFLASKKIRPALIVVTVGFFLVTGIISKTNWGSARFHQTSIFSFNGQSKARATNAAYAAGEGKILFVRVFNNKLVVYTREFIRQYLSYFSFNYLFTDGGRPNRYLVPDHGLLYYSFGAIPLGFIALAYFYPKTLKKMTPVDKRFATYLLFVLLFTPLAAALTLDEVPNVHRSAIEGVMLIFPIALSFHYLHQIRFKFLGMTTLILLAIILESTYFLNQYIIQAPRAQTVERYDERTDLAHWLIANHNSYDQVYVTREIFTIYYLFYSNNFDKSLAGKFEGPLVIPNVDNVHFIDSDCPSIVSEVPKTGKILIVDRAPCQEREGLKVVETILRSNATEAYRMLVPAPLTDN